MSHAITQAATSDARSNQLQSVSEALNVLLADVFSLYFKTKNFHWHMSGPAFRDYHLLLDEQAGQLIGISDAIAERVRKIGGTTLRSIGDVQRHQRISDNNSPNIRPVEMLRELLADNRSIIDSLHTLKTLADDAGDNATSGILDNWTDEAEQRAWFLFEATREA